MRADILKEDRVILPSMMQLAKRYGVSESTVLSSARILRDEGLLDFGRGRRARIVRTAGRDSQALNSPMDRCISSLKARISTGELKAGESFDKTSVLSRELHVSRTTIAQTFRELSRQGLAHKIGKKWLIGPQVATTSSKESQFPSFIVCIVPHARSWQGLSTQSRTTRFCFEFSSEAERYGVSFMPAFSNPEYGRKTMVCRNLEDTIRYIRSREKQCLGVLFAANENRSPDTRPWIARISAAGIKSVWFDRYDQGGISIRRGMCVRRCHYSERAAVKIAVGYLASLGHSRILYDASCDNPQSWQTNRFKLLTEACESLGPTITPTRPSNENATEIPADEQLHGFMRSPASLKSDLLKSKATAIIAPNDFAAIKIYNALCQIGLSIPGDISLLSFDNDPFLQISPISTVDFGMGYLGYCAFHYLFGILPIKHDRNGDIQARPHIVNRGSVGLSPGGRTRQKGE